MMRPVLVGMNNPQGNAPLWPDPPGCTGHRIWRMLCDGMGHEVSRKDYLRAFRRYNLVDGKTWNRVRGRARAADMFSYLTGDRVVLLGTEVRAAFAFPRVEPCRWQTGHPFEWCAVHHPSGRCRWYNDPGHRMMVSRVLADLYRGAT